MQVEKMFLVLILIFLFIILTSYSEYFSDCKSEIENLNKTNLFMSNQLSNKIISTQNDNVLRLNELLLN